MALNIPLPAYNPHTITNTLSRLDQLQKLNAEARYAPYTNYANAAAKMAFSQFVGPQSYAKLLSDPATRGLLTSDQQKQLAGAIASQIGSGNAIANLPIPGGMGNFSNSLVGQLVNYLTGGGQNNPQQNAMTQNPSKPIPNNPFSGNPQLQTASPQEVNDKANQSWDKTFGGNNTTPSAPVGMTKIGYETPLSRQAQSLKIPGTLGAESAAAAQDAQEAANKVAATGQAQAQTKQHQQTSERLSTQATAANNALHSLEGFHRNYLGSSYVGQYAGSRPSSGEGSIPNLPGHSSSPEQSADRYQNQFLNDITAIAGTTIGNTDMAKSMIQSAKFSRSLDKDAELEAYQENKSKLKRLLILRKFANWFRQQNPSATEEELIGMMNEYNEMAPPFDYETGKSLPHNDKRFREFASQEALESYRKNGFYQPQVNNETTKIWPKTKDAINEDKVEGQVPPKGSIWMIRPDGMKVPVHGTRKNEAMKLNYREIG